MFYDEGFLVVRSRRLRPDGAHPGQRTAYLRFSIFFFKKKQTKTFLSQLFEDDLDPPPFLTRRDHRIVFHVFENVVNIVRHGHRGARFKVCYVDGPGWSAVMIEGSRSAVAMVHDGPDGP